MDTITGSSSTPASPGASDTPRAAGATPATKLKGGGGRGNPDVLTPQDLQMAYNMSLQTNNELTQQQLQNAGWSREKIVAAFNRLNEARAGVIRKKGEELCCVTRTANIISSLKKLDPFDYKIYCAIELAGNTGVWTADIRKSTGLQTHIIQKGVRNLSENLQLIKPVKNIQVKNRKMYILAHMEPSKEIAGGSFYTNGEFNEQLVEHLRAHLSTFLQNARSSSFSSLVAYARSSGDVGGATFSNEDIMAVINTLEFEDKIARINTGNDITFIWNHSPMFCSVNEVPCSSCPISRSCALSPNSPVSPSSCEYLSYWLGLDVQVDTNEEGKEE